MAAEAGDIREVERDHRRFCVRERVSAVAFYQLRRKLDGDFAGRLTKRSGAVRPPEEALRFLPVRIETGELVDIELPIANDQVNPAAAKTAGIQNMRDPPLGLNRLLAAASDCPDFRQIQKQLSPLIETSTIKSKSVVAVPQCGIGDVDICSSFACLL